MPALVDYAARFALIREAAFAIVLRDGPHALTRRAVAAEMAISVNSVCRLVAPGVDLARLAADDVRLRRRLYREALPRDDQRARGLAILCRLIPDEESRIPEELVWLRLTVAGNDALTSDLHHRDVEVTDAITWTLTAWGVAERDRDEAATSLRALVDGLTLACCTGRSTPEEAVAALSRHLAGLADTSGPRSELVEATTLSPCPSPPRS